MARRNNSKIKKAQHDAMLNEERDQLAKRQMRAERRKRKAVRQQTESILCKAFDMFSAVGEGSKSPVPRVGAPIITDTKMKTPKVSKQGRIKKNKKAARRVKKIRQRQASRSAMEM